MPCSVVPVTLNSDFGAYSPPRPAAALLMVQVMRLPSIEPVIGGACGPGWNSAKRDVPLLELADVGDPPKKTGDAPWGCMPTNRTWPRALLSGALLRLPAHQDTTTVAVGPLAGLSMATWSALLSFAVTRMLLPASCTLTSRRSSAGLLVPSAKRRASPAGSATRLVRDLSSARELTFL